MIISETAFRSPYLQSRIVKCCWFWWDPEELYRCVRWSDIADVAGAYLLECSWTVVQAWLCTTRSATSITPWHHWLLLAVEPRQRSVVMAGRQEGDDANRFYYCLWLSLLSKTENVQNVTSFQRSKSWRFIIVGSGFLIRKKATYDKSSKYLKTVWTSSILSINIY